MGVKERLADTKKQQEIARKVFSNSVLKDKEGNPVTSVQLGGKYYLHSKDSDKKVGWVQLGKPGKASVGWVNLPDYMKMEEPSNVPEEFRDETWDEVDLAEYEMEAEIETSEPEVDGKTEDVARYMERLALAARDNIDKKISDKELSRLQEIYEHDCDYEGVDDVLDEINDYTGLVYIQYRSEAAFKNGKPIWNGMPQSYVSLSEQLEKPKAEIRESFEQAHPDLDFDVLVERAMAAKYPVRYRTIENAGVGYSQPPTNEERRMERLSYIFDYSVRSDDYARSKRRDLTHDGMSPEQWKTNRMMMHQDYMLCDFIEQDYKSMYGDDVFVDERNYGLSSGRAISIEKLEKRLEEKYDPTYTPDFGTSVEL